MNPILIILPDMIGTIVCSIPAINAIYRYFPENPKKIVGIKGVCDFLLDEEFSADLLVVPTYFDSLCCTTHITYQYIFDFCGSREAVSYIGQLSATHIIGWDHYNSNIYTHSVSFSDGSNTVWDYLKFLSKINLLPQFESPKLSPTSKQHNEFHNPHEHKKFLPDGDYVVLGVGAGNQFKRWPIENFIKISSQIEKKHKIKTVFAIGPKELELRESILVRKPDANILENLNIHKVKQVLSKAAGCICNDFGLMHISAALNLPTLAIFLSSNPHEWFPYDSPRARYVIGQDLPCRPCYSEDCSDWKCNSPNLLQEVVRIIDNGFFITSERISNVSKIPHIL